MAGAEPFLFHQSYGFKHLKVLRDRRAADGKPARQLTDGGGPLPEQIENSLPGWIRECAEQPGLVSHD